MPIAFITLKMVFVLAWTIGDASSLACQSWNQVLFFYSSMSSGLLTLSKFDTVIRCDTTDPNIVHLKYVVRATHGAAPSVELATIYPSVGYLE
jgi:hypothetical protein